MWITSKQYQEHIIIFILNSRSNQHLLACNQSYANKRSLSIRKYYLLLELKLINFMLYSLIGIVVLQFCITDKIFALFH